MPTGSMYPAAIVRLLRPQFALTGLVLYSVGALYAAQPGAAVPLDRLAAGFLCVLAGHLGINAVNDYFDREDDRYGTPTRFSGGSGVLVADPEFAPAALALAVGLSVASLLGAVLFSSLYGPNPWFVGLTAAALVTGWCYSAPPVRLSARGLGEVPTALAFVFLPGFGYAAAAGRLDPGFVVLALPLFLLGLSFILAVELPDLEADAAAGRLNFAVQHGRPAAARGMLACAGAAALAYAVLAAGGPEPRWFAVTGLALSLLPLASATHATFRMKAGRAPAEWACSLHVAALNLLALGLGLALAAAR